MFKELKHVKTTYLSALTLLSGDTETAEIQTRAPINAVHQNFEST